VSDIDSGAAPPCDIVELASDPDAPRWARDCGWVPGTGHCRNRPCSPACLFRAQREAEAERVIGSRRQRRRAQLPFADRAIRMLPTLLSLCSLATLV